MSALIRTAAATHGTNNSSPTGAAYTASVPAQTAAAAFCTGGAEAMGEYKQEVTKKIVLGVIGLVFTVLGFIAGPALLRWLQ